METVVGDEDCKISVLVEIFRENPTYGLIQQNLHDLSRVLDIPNDIAGKLKQDVLLGIISSSEALTKILECWVNRCSRKATPKVLTDALRFRCKWVCMADSIMRSDRLDIVWPIYITTKWTDLNPRTKNHVLSTPVQINGHQVKLKTFLEFGDIVGDSEIRRYLNCQLLHDIVNGSKLVLFKNSIPSELPFYQQRRIRSSMRLDERVFTVECQLVFAIHGIDWFDLSKLVEGHLTDRSSSQLQSNRLTVRFILLECLEEFNELCKLSSNDIHLIEYIEGHFYLQLSCPCRQNTEFLSSYFHPEQKSFSEDDFLSNLSADKHLKPILITDIAGSGKTQMLASIARNLQSQSLKNLVLFINITSLSESLQNLGTDFKYENVMHEISFQHSNNELERHVLHKMLTKSDNFDIHLFFDDINELCETTKRTFKILYEPEYKVRLYVSARSHMRKDLERLLGVNSISLETFTRDEQVKYFTKYWEIHGNVEINEITTNFAEKILSKIDTNILLDSTPDNLVGQPIQCHMLAEVYLKEAKKLGYSNVLGYIIPIKTVFEVYRNYMKNQFLQAAPNVDIINLMRARYISFALDLQTESSWHLFRPVVNEYLVKSDATLSTQAILQVGILELSSQKNDSEEEIITFIHQTYSDYMLAEFVANIIRNSEIIKIDSDDLRRKFTYLVFKNILESQENCDQILRRSATDFETMKHYRFKNPVFCFFLDSHLGLQSENEQDNALDIFQGQVFCSMPLNPNLIKIFYQILSSCIVANYNNIFAVVSQFFLSLLHESSSFKLHVGKYAPWKNLLLIAAKHSSFPSLSTICNFEKFLGSECGCNLNFLLQGINPLTVSAQRGDYAVFSYFLLHNKTYGYTKADYYDMIFYCVVDSLCDSTGQISQKKLILKLLFEKIENHCVKNIIPDNAKKNIHKDMLMLLNNLTICEI